LHEQIVVFFSFVIWSKQPVPIRPLHARTKDSLCATIEIHTNEFLGLISKVSTFMERFQGNYIFKNREVCSWNEACLKSLGGAVASFNDRISLQILSDLSVLDFFLLEW